MTINLGCLSYMIQICKCGTKFNNETVGECPFCSQGIEEPIDDILERKAKHLLAIKKYRVNHRETYLDYQHRYYLKRKEQGFYSKEYNRKRWIRTKERLGITNL